MGFTKVNLTNATPERCLEYVHALQLERHLDNHPMIATFSNGLKSGSIGHKEELIKVIHHEGVLIWLLLVAQRGSKRGRYNVLLCSLGGEAMTEYDLAAAMLTRQLIVREPKTLRYMYCFGKVPRLTFERIRHDDKELEQFISDEDISDGELIE